MIDWEQRDITQFQAELISLKQLQCEFVKVQATKKSTQKRFIKVLDVDL